MSGPVALCVDLGSTYTKAAAVDLVTGRLLGTADHPTTIEPDVMVGIDAVRRQLAGVAPDPVLLACSSAGGGLRLAVVGYEREISAEAGHRAAMSAGARVVHVSAGRLGHAGITALNAATPDVVLLVGGTDGGESSVLLHNASALASSAVGTPIVVAGNIAARQEVCAILQAEGVTVVTTDNVLPDIGEFAPEPARAVIRRVFLDHVIGGKRLSADPAFATLIRAVTPDAVLDGVTVLAEALRSSVGAASAPSRSRFDGSTSSGSGSGPSASVAAAPFNASGQPGSVVVVDVGGATTDVYCVLSPDAEQVMLGREAVGVPGHRRTVEGDLGLRWSPGALLAAAAGERLVADSEAGSLRRWIASRGAGSSPPETVIDRANELRLAGLAVTIALRRHVRAEAAYGVSGTTGASARTARTVVLSGGAIRHASAAERAALVAAVLEDRGGARGVLLDADVRCDSRYVLAAAGPLAAEYPDAARGVIRSAGLVS